MAGNTSAAGSGPEARRTFVAIELPAPVRDELARVADALAGQWPAGSVRWTRPEGIHLTLRFLGDTRPDQVEELGAGLERIAADHAPFDLELGEVGAFPTASRPRVLWVGVKDPGEALRPVQQAVEELARSLGWDRERQSYKPHLTLGRVRDRARPPGPWQVAVGRACFRAAGLVLMESLLKPTGAEYVRLHQALLAAAGQTDPDQ